MQCRRRFLYHCRGGAAGCPGGRTASGAPPAETLPLAVAQHSAHLPGAGRNFLQQSSTGPPAAAKHFLRLRRDGPAAPGAGAAWRQPCGARAQGCQGGGFHLHGVFIMRSTLQVLYRAAQKESYAACVPMCGIWHATQGIACESIALHHIGTLVRRLPPRGAEGFGAWAWRAGAWSCAAATRAQGCQRGGYSCAWSMKYI